MWIDPTNKEITDVPDGVEHFINNWRDSHPDWSIIFWNMDMCEQLFKSEPELQPFYSDIFEKPWMNNPSECTDAGLSTLYLCPITGIMRKKSAKMNNRMAIADTCRLAVVYIFGGVYLDLSMNPLKGLNTAWEDFPQRDVLYCWEPEENEADSIPKCLNSLIGARYPKNTFWLEFLKYICDNRNTYRNVRKYIRYDPVTVTGPYMLAEWATNVVKDPNYKPLPSCTFARRIFWESKMSKHCTESDGYAEKIWIKSSNWGGKKKSIFELGRHFIVKSFYILVLIGVLIFLLMKKWEWINSTF